MTTFHFEIVSPDGIIYTDDVEVVLLPTSNGEIGILPHHIPLFTKLEAGEVRIKKGAEEISVAITGGFLDVQKSHVTLLSDHAIRADNIEIARAEEAKKRAERLLEERAETENFALVEKDLARSIIELHIADKVRKRRVS